MAATILITRPEDRALELADKIRARLGCGPRIVISPLMKIEFLAGLPTLQNVKTLIFSSAHGVRAFAALSHARDFRCYAVGEATADAARNCGLQPIEGGGTGAALARRIISDRPAPGRLYLRGEHAAFDVAGTLCAAGLETQEAIIYRQAERRLSAPARDALTGQEPVVVPLFSPRSAELLFGQAGPSEQTAPLFVAAMSERVAAAVPAGRATRLKIAPTPSSAAMLDAVASLVADANRLESDDRPQ